jgi:hypothetical protein
VTRCARPVQTSAAPGPWSGSGRGPGRAGRTPTASVSPFAVPVPGPDGGPSRPQPHRGYRPPAVRNGGSCSADRLWPVTPPRGRWRRRVSGFPTAGQAGPRPRSISRRRRSYHRRAEGPETHRPLFLQTSRKEQQIVPAGRRQANEIREPDPHQRLRSRGRRRAAVLVPQYLDDQRGRQRTQPGPAEYRRSPGLPGFAPPSHIHQASDEALLVLDGQLDGFCGTGRGAPGPARSCSCRARSRTVSRSPRPDHRDGVTRRLRPVRRDCRTSLYT